MSSLAMMKESLPFLSGILLLIRHSVKTERGISGGWVIGPSDGLFFHDQREELPTTRPELLFCWAQPLAYRLLAAAAVSPGAAAPISPAKYWGHCPVTRRNDSL